MYIFINVLKLSEMKHLSNLNKEINKELISNGE